MPEKPAIDNAEVLSLDDEITEIVEEAKALRYSLDPHVYVHLPNRIPTKTRWKYIVLSTCLIIYGTYGIWVDDIYIPGRRGPGVHLHGVPLLFMYAAMLSAATNMISVVADHYDQRNNEADYREFAKVTAIAGWVLTFAALLLHAFVFSSINYLKGY